MIQHPRITLGSIGPEILDLRPAQDTIRAQYGPRYHLDPNCLQEIAALWGVGVEHACINDAGVFLARDSFALRQGHCCAGIHMARSPSGLWAMATSYTTSRCGGGSAPSVWNGFAFLTESDSRMAGIHKLISKFQAIALEDGPGAMDARQMIAVLRSELTPQLALF